MDIYTIASQVQQVIKEEEEEKTDSLFESIREELKRRKKMLSGGNFNQYKYWGKGSIHNCLPAL